MGSRRRTRTWRWRNNPLRRGEDLLEAWTVVIVWAVMALGGVAVGAATAHAAADLFAGQRAERHAVGAVLLGDVPGLRRGPGAAVTRTPPGSAGRTMTAPSAPSGRGWSPGRRPGNAS
ncbi:hypothetical protein AB0D95_02275 [Streptomyces chilikensis]|uniref:Uncharacterized protein n=1 Tax=Streptomyces chilikensis TaxID=1194079 RepID=A0ABV3EIU6_9ACTN